MMHQSASTEKDQIFWISTRTIMSTVDTYKNKTYVLRVQTVLTLLVGRNEVHGRRVLTTAPY